MRKRISREEFAKLYPGRLNRSVDDLLNDPDTYESMNALLAERLDRAYVQGLDRGLSHEDAKIKARKDQGLYVDPVAKIAAQNQMDVDTINYYRQRMRNNRLNYNKGDTVITNRPMMNRFRRPPMQGPAEPPMQGPSDPPMQGPRDLYVRAQDGEGFLDMILRKFLNLDERYARAVSAMDDNRFRQATSGASIRQMMNNPVEGTVDGPVDALMYPVLQYGQPISNVMARYGATTGGGTLLTKAGADLLALTGAFGGEADEPERGQLPM